MTPRRRGPTATYTDSNYRGKVPRLLNTIRSVLGSDVPIAVWNYYRLDYDNRTEELMGTETLAGHACFQFDPNGGGQGLPQ